MKFIIQKLKSKHTSLKKYTNWAKLTEKIWYIFILFWGNKRRKNPNILLLKGQLILKANYQAVNSSNNEWMNSFLQVCDVFSFIFWKKMQTPKRLFKIISPLALKKVNSAGSFYTKRLSYWGIPCTISSLSTTKGGGYPEELRSS